MPHNLWKNHATGLPLRAAKEAVLPFSCKEAALLLCRQREQTECRKKAGRVQAKHGQGADKEQAECRQSAGRERTKSRQRTDKEQTESRQRADRVQTKSRQGTDEKQAESGFAAALFGGTGNNPYFCGKISQN